MDSRPSEKRFALIIDADNVSSKYIKPITDELSKYGTITYKRIYGDWTSTLHAKWKDALLENSITPIQQFSYTTGKNATDSAMIIDAMDIMYTNSVEGFCIVSSDSDFTRLASRIRESGLTVIGMGEKKTPTPFRKACDIFTTLELLVGEDGKQSGKRGHRGQGSQAAGQGSGPAIEQVERAVVDIVTDNQNNGKATGLGEVGSRLLKRYPDFDVRSYGTNQLTKLLGEFASVQVIKDGSSVMVELTESAPAAPDAPEEDKQTAEQENTEKQDGEKPKRSRRGRSRRGRSKAGSGEAAGQPQDAARGDEQGSIVESVSDQMPNAIAESDTPSTVDSAADTSQPSEEVPEIDAESNVDDAPEPEMQVPGAVGPDEVQPAADAVQASNRSDKQVSQPTPAEKSSRDSKPRKTPKRKPRAAKSSEQADAQAPAAPTPRRHKPAPSQTPESLVFDAVRSAGAEGVSVAELTKQVRASFKDFKVRDRGFTQMRQFVASLADIRVEKRGSAYFATLEE